MQNFELIELQNNISYFFKDDSLLINALTHSSYANENKMGINHSNERLEFLGDSILNLIVSLYLFNKYPDFPEGELTKKRAKVVCEYSLAFGAKKINLGKYLFLGKGEETTGGRQRESILADAVEALIGAIYLDSSFMEVNNILLRNFEKDIVKALVKGDLFIDYKTELQEKFQTDSNTKIEYLVYKEKGPDHNKTFYMDVYINGSKMGSGQGKNKKESEQMAARDALFGKGNIND